MIPNSIGHRIRLMIEEGRPDWEDVEWLGLEAPSASLDDLE